MPRVLDPAGLDEVLTFWSCVAPRTVFLLREPGEAGEALTRLADHL